MNTTQLPTISHECEGCGEQIELDHSKLVAGQRVRCSHCGALYEADVDAEFVDGRWLDRTNLWHI